MSRPREKAVWRYDADSQAWETSSDGGTPLGDSLRVASFNLWFDSYCWRERLDAVLQLLSEHQPDLIGLQEVRPKTLRAVLAEPWVRAAYAVSDTDPTAVDPYGTLILSRVAVLGFETVPFPTEMGRCLLQARLEHQQRALRFATVHLESLDNALTRGLQLEIISKQLGKLASIVVGDFNLSAAGDENPQLAAQGWLDLWSALHPEDPGYTVDCQLNSMHMYLSRDPKRVRYDRIVARPARVWQPVAIERIGTEAICQPTPAESEGFMDEISLFPSDHFGLVGEWRLRSGS